MRIDHLAARRTVAVAFAAAVFIGGLVAGCAPPATLAPTQAPPTDMPPIETTEDLMAALALATGGSVGVEGAAQPEFGVSGEIVRVAGETVAVYAFPDPASRATAQSEIDPQRLTFLGQPLAGWKHPRIWGVGRLLVVYDGSQGGTFLVLSGLLGDPLAADAAAPAPDEPYPPAVSAAIGALARSEGVDPGQVAVLSYSAATWPDGCLGLPGEGDACAPGSVQGWQVNLKVGGASFEVRTDDLGGRVRWRR